MRRLDVKRQMGAGDIAAVSRLLALAEEGDGHHPLGEHQWLDLVQGGRPGFAGLVAWEPGHDHPVGYAQLTRGTDTWQLRLVVDPHHRRETFEIGSELLHAAFEVVGEHGGGRVHLWVPKPTGGHDRLARGAGLVPGRELLQLRRPLPVGAAARAGSTSSAGLATRPFRPGEDEEAWLAVNNRAFRDHPEQGDWTLDTLRSREAQPWFDAEGFLLHERDGRLVGFCWTKVHGDLDPPLGEIYVIAVNPDFGGLGLGRALVVAGLDWLHERGLATAMLYVDAANVVARHLYESLGFTVDHAERTYVGDVPAP